MVKTVDSERRTPNIVRLELQITADEIPDETCLRCQRVTQKRHGQHFFHQDQFVMKGVLEYYCPHCHYLELIPEAMLEGFALTVQELRKSQPDAEDLIEHYEKLVADETKWIAERNQERQQPR